MKTASDVMLNKVIQKVKTLISGKANSTHSHDDQYSNGARRTYNSGLLGSNNEYVRVESIKERFYIVHIGSTKDKYAAATVCVDWQMFPERDGSEPDALQIGYTLVIDKLVDGVRTYSYENGFLYAQKTSAGYAVFIAGDESNGHYIKRVCGFM